MNVDTTKTGTSDLEAEVTSIFLNVGAAAASIIASPVTTKQYDL